MKFENLQKRKVCLEIVRRNNRIFDRKLGSVSEGKGLRLKMDLQMRHLHLTWLFRHDQQKRFAVKGRHFLFLLSSFIYSSSFQTCVSYTLCPIEQSRWHDTVTSIMARSFYGPAMSTATTMTFPTKQRQNVFDK